MLIEIDLACFGPFRAIAKADANACTFGLPFTSFPEVGVHNRGALRLEIREQIARLRRELHYIESTSTPNIACAPEANRLSS